MGKRSSFERVARDFYPTPYEAVLPLLSHLPPRTSFIEPCVGAGDLVGHLIRHGHCYVAGYDIEPKVFGAERQDARTLCLSGDASQLTFITNPPWRREILHDIIVNLSDQLPTWLLFDADWKHTKQAAPFLNRLRRIVSVGRVKWIPNSKCTGKDNCVWYLFDRPHNAPAEFYGRAGHICLAGLGGGSNVDQHCAYSDSVGLLGRFTGTRAGDAFTKRKADEIGTFAPLEVSLDRSHGHVIQGMAAPHDVLNAAAASAVSAFGRLLEDAADGRVTA